MSAAEAATHSGGGQAQPTPASSMSRKSSSASALPPADALIARVASEIGVSGGLSLANVLEFPADEECLIVRLSQDRSLWAVGLSSGRVQLHRTDTGALAYALDPQGRLDKQTVTGLVFLPSEPQQQQKKPKPERRHLLLASYATGQIRLWHYTAAAEPLLWSLTEEVVAASEGGRSGANQILCLAGSADGQRFLTGGADAAIRVYDTRRRGLINLCQSSLSTSRVDGHRNRVCALAYHPLGRQRPADYGHLFVSGGWDNTVQIWDDRRPRSLWVYFGPHVCGSDALDVDPGQGHILTGSWERHKSMLQVWKFNEDAAHGRLDLDDQAVQEDMLKGRPLGELQQDPTGAPSMGYVAQWLGTQYMVFAGSNSNVLKVLDRGTLNIVAGVVNLPRGVYSMAYAPEVGGGGGGGSGDSRKPPPQKLLAFCAGNRLYVMKFERK